MNAETQKKIGDFCWVELCTKGFDKAKKFYHSILGWKFEDIPMPQNEECAYTMIKIGDFPVAGGYELTPEFESRGASASWRSYVLVENVDKATNKAKTLGANEIAPPFDVGEMGRMSILSDPTGVVFFLWQSTANESSVNAPKNQEGNLGWNELVTNDTEKAGKFYSDLFGWDQQVEEVKPGRKYTTFLNDGVPVAGMVSLTDARGDATPHWEVYFNVDNLDATLKTAKEQSATIMYDPVEHPEVGRFTMLRDPQGVHFSVIEFRKGT